MSRRGKGGRPSAAKLRKQHSRVWRENPARAAKPRIPALRTLMRRIRDVVERAEPSMVESFDESEVSTFVEYCLAAWRTLAFDAVVQKQMTAAWQDNYVSLQWRNNSVHVVSLFAILEQRDRDLVIPTWRVTVDTPHFSETLGHYLTEELAEAAAQDWILENHSDDDPNDDEIGFDVEEVTDEDYRVHSPASVHFLYAHPHDDVNTPHGGAGNNAWKADELRATGQWEPREYRWVYTEPPPWPADDLPTLNPSDNAKPRRLSAEIRALVEYGLEGWSDASGFDNLEAWGDRGDGSYTSVRNREAQRRLTRLADEGALDEDGVDLLRALEDEGRARIVKDAKSAAEEGRLVLEAFEEGDLSEAIARAKNASNIERAFGDDPSWRPLRSRLEGLDNEHSDALVDAETDGLPLFEGPDAIEATIARANDIAQITDDIERDEAIERWCKITDPSHALSILGRAFKENPSATEALASFADLTEPEALEDFYDGDGEEMLAGASEDAIRYGRRVTWIGIPGQMIEIDPNYVVPMWGNVFDAGKLAAVANAVRNGEKPVLGVGFGTVQIIDASTIEEANASMESGDTEWPTDRPFDERDIGKLLYTIRDGNHRTFGALIGGERKVWINLYDNTFQLVKQWRAMLDGVKSKKKRAEIIHDFFIGAERWPQSYVDLISRLDQKLRED